MNYCAVAAAQYLTLGDVATVTLQYSKRPSPLSLGRIGAAREQNRLLMLHVLERLRDRPADRRPEGGAVRREPRGAHQPGHAHALGHPGPAGTRDRPRPVDRHPVQQQVDAPGHRSPPTRRRPRPSSGCSTTTPSTPRCPPSDRARLRYVLVSHDNDGVTKFGADLVTSRPRWLVARTAPRSRRCRGPAPAASRPRCGGGPSPRSCRP